MYDIPKIGYAICFVPVLAIALDMLIGDPPNRWRWRGGSTIFIFKRMALKHGRFIPLISGIVFILLGSGITGSIVFLLVKLIHFLHFS